MKTTKDKYNNQYTFQISLILSLFVFICLFKFYPVIISNSNKNISVLFDNNDVIFIPVTTQVSKRLSAPKLPKIIITDTEIDIPILDDINVTTTISNSDKKISTNNFIHKYFQPRQTLEVIPQKINSNVKGYVKINIQIGSDGKVKSYKILANTTDSKECLKEVIIAIYKSRWESFKSITSTKDFWVKKTYMFN